MCLYPQKYSAPTHAADRRRAAPLQCLCAKHYTPTAQARRELISRVLFHLQRCFTILRFPPLGPRALRYSETSEHTRSSFLVDHSPCVHVEWSFQNVARKSKLADDERAGAVYPARTAAIKNERGVASSFVIFSPTTPGTRADGLSAIKGDHTMDSSIKEEILSA